MASQIAKPWLADYWILRASLVDFTADGCEPGRARYRFYEDGYLAISGGKIQESGCWPPTVRNAPLLDLSGYLVMPGFVDSHIHYPQISMIASHGEQLLTWLHKYTFATEARFADPEVCRLTANFVLDQLLRHGTTTAQVYATVHEGSVSALFSAAEARGMGLISGKVMMDQCAPDALTEEAAACHEACQRLIAQWHKRGRLGYAITPRFALTSSDRQLQLAGELAAADASLYVQSHLSENTEELRLIKERFTAHEDYAAVYDHYGLLRPRSTWAHGIHLSPAEWQRLSGRRAGIAFCPTSNLFLGSGLFDLASAQRYGVKVSLGTDIGAGTSLSMFATMRGAYQVGQLQGQVLDPVYAYYLATRGGAEALDLADQVGAFDAGLFADFVVLDRHATPISSQRTEHCESLEDLLFALIILADDRHTAATFVAGKPRSCRGTDVLPGFAHGT